MITEAEHPQAAHFAVMEGGGAYNCHALQQAAGAAYGIPALEAAAGAISAGRDGAITLADYGSSQGRNSISPMRAAIAVLRARFGAGRPIAVTHIDQPENDFNALFRMLDAAPDSYLAGDPAVFASAVGRSFYEPVLPPASVDLGWCAYAVHWLSGVPEFDPAEGGRLNGTGALGPAFEAWAAADWRHFLELRGRELRPGGRLVILVPAMDETGRHGIEPMMEIASETIAALVSAGIITAEEQRRIVIPHRLRGRDALLAPFAETGRFAGLSVEQYGVFRTPDVMWASYGIHGDAGRLARERARFFRATFLPSLEAALSPGRTTADRQAFADGLEAGLMHRFETYLTPIPTTVANLTLTRA